MCGVYLSLKDVSKSFKEVHRTDQNIDEQTYIVVYEWYL